METYVTTHFPALPDPSTIKPRFSTDDVIREAELSPDSSLVFYLAGVDVRDGHEVVHNLEPTSNDASNSAQMAENENVVALAKAAQQETNGWSDETAALHAPCLARVWGTTPAGAKITCIVPFRPAFQVLLGPVVLNNGQRTTAPLRSADLRAALVYCAKALGLQMGVDVTVEVHRSVAFKNYEPTPGNVKERREHWVAEVACPNFASQKALASKLRWWAPYSGVDKRGPKMFASAIHEDGIDGTEAFIDSFQMEPGRWHSIALSAGTMVRLGERTCLGAAEFRVNALPTHKRPTWFVRGDHNRSPFRVRPDLNSVVPSVVAVSFDEEMTSSDIGRFPQASLPSDAIVCASLVFQFTGGDAPLRPRNQVFHRMVLVLAPLLETVSAMHIDGVEIRGFGKESEMLNALRDILFVEYDVDVLMGHNILDFDIPYSVQRGIQTAADRFLRWGSCISLQLQPPESMATLKYFGDDDGDEDDDEEEKPPAPTRKKFKRAAEDDEADNEKREKEPKEWVVAPGIVVMDSLTVARNTQKESVYSLKHLCAKFLPDGANKADMPYDVIPVVAKGTDGAAWSALASYCVQDAVLVIKLLEKWNAVTAMLCRASEVTTVFAEDVRCGQQRRVQTSFMYHARTMNMFVNGIADRNNSTFRKHGDDEAPVVAEGGRVLDCVQGFCNDPVIVLDFASLYPSVQLRHNLCYSTYVPPETLEHLTLHDRKELGVVEHRTSTGTFAFATKVEGVLPKLLRALLSARERYKAEMAHAYKMADECKAGGDVIGQSTWQEVGANANVKQLATKIVANSVYGASNVDPRKGTMPFRPLGTTTCYLGACANRSACEVIAKDFPECGILYGDTDSIMVRASYTSPEQERAMTGPQLLQRLLDGFAKGKRIVTAINQFLRSAELEEKGLDPTSPEGVAYKQITRMEFENIYCPYEVLAGKTYKGYKFDKAPPADLDTSGTPVEVWGRIMKLGKLVQKGLRTVKRDVPEFVRTLGQAAVSEMMLHRSADAAWPIVHDIVRKVCRGFRPSACTFTEEDANARFPLKAYAQTGEYNESAHVVTFQMAVARGEEWRVPGSGPALKTRVAFVFAGQPDPRRLVAPPWMKVPGKSVEELAPMPKHGTPTPKCEVECKARAARARSVEEVEETGEWLDIEHYVKTIKSAMSQICPLYVRDAQELERYARDYSATVKTLVSSKGWSHDNPELYRAVESCIHPLRFYGLDSMKMVTLGALFRKRSEDEGPAGAGAAPQRPAEKATVRVTAAQKRAKEEAKKATVKAQQSTFASLVAASSLPKQTASLAAVFSTRPPGR